MNAHMSYQNSFRNDMLWNILAWRRSNQRRTISSVPQNTFPYGMIAKCQELLNKNINFYKSAPASSRYNAIDIEIAHSVTTSQHIWHNTQNQEQILTSPNYIII